MLWKWCAAKFFSEGLRWFGAKNRAMHKPKTNSMGRIPHWHRRYFTETGFGFRMQSLLEFSSQ